MFAERDVTSKVKKIHIYNPRINEYVIVLCEG
jgi:hypothetical protein